LFFFFSISEWKPFSIFIRVRVRVAYLSSVIEIKSSEDLQIKSNSVYLPSDKSSLGKETAKKQYSYLSLLPPHQAKKYTVPKAKASQHIE